MNYFEYRKEIQEYPFDEALKLLSEWYMFSREWEHNENYNVVLRSTERQFRNLISEGIITGKIEGNFQEDQIEKDGSIFHGIQLDESSVFLPSLISYILDKISKKEFAAPEKFIAILKNEPVDIYKKSNAHGQAKKTVQAVARTLWDTCPDMRNEDMQKHPAILEYAGGNMYQGKNTLRDWLSEVDPRPSSSKPGPKKKEKD